MSAVDNFRSKLASDPNFAKSVKGCTNADEIIAAAKKAGINITHADVARAVAAGSSELTDAELESVSSGTILAAALVK